MLDPLIPRSQDPQNPQVNVQRAERASSGKEHSKNDKETQSVQQSTVSRPGSASGAQKEPPRTIQEIEKEIERLTSILGENTNLEFRISRATGDFVVHIVDKKTKEVVKTIPSSEIRNVGSKITLRSLLFDRKT